MSARSGEGEPGRAQETFDILSGYELTYSQINALFYVRRGFSCICTFREIYIKWNVEEYLSTRVVFSTVGQRWFMRSHHNWIIITMANIFYTLYKA